MKVTISSRLGFYLALGLAGMLGALLLGRPEPALLVLPFLGAVGLGLALARPPDLRAAVRVDRERVIEGEEVEVAVEVEALRPVPSLEVALEVPAGTAVQRLNRARPVGLAAGAVHTELWRLTPQRWGGRLRPRVEVRARDPLGFFTWRLGDERFGPLRVYPRPESLRDLLTPAETQIRAGNRVSRLRGDGIEFADVRPFVPGDRVRRINWRVSARRGELHVNEMRPERNADVVIFIDTFAGLDEEATLPQGSTLDLVVRAAAALARAYLERRDRVGLVSFGGTLRWLRPEMGLRQAYRVADALIDTQVVLNYAWKGLEVIPRRTIPAKSLVVALTPLLDDRSLGALLDLRGRGHDLGVIEVSPLPFVSSGQREAEKVAYRLWEMEREALRGRFLSMGVPIASWRRGEPLEPVLASASAFRRQSGRGQP